MTPEAATDKSVLASVVPPLDSVLMQQLVREYVSMERRFVLEDWEPATLDGGQFAEAASRILYHMDSGNCDRSRPVAKCLRYVEENSAGHLHSYPDRKSALHTCKVLRMIYKFRSDRGAVHIDETYTANHLDASLLLEGCRWILAEMLRVFWTGNQRTAASVVRSLIDFPVPAIADFGGQLLVQRTDLTAEEEVLLLLYRSGVAGMSRSSLGRFVKKSPASVSGAVKKLTNTATRQVVKLPSGNLRLTDLGVRRVVLELGDRLGAA